VLFSSLYEDQVVLKDFLGS